MGNENSRLGVTGSNASDLGSMGALYPILTQLGGGSKAGQMAMDYAQQMYPDAPKADPWEAALQYFLAMGQAASEPGATLLGSGVRAMQAPADYLAAKKTEKRETDRARMQTALQLAPSLKPPAATKAGYTNVTVDGIAQVMTSTEIQAAKAAGKVVAPYDTPSATSSTYKEQKFYKLGQDSAVIKNETDAALFAADGWVTVPPTGWKPPPDSVGAAEVKSSKILDGGVVVSVLSDNTVTVRNGLGELLPEGQSRADAIKAAEERGIEIQGDRSQQRGLGDQASKIVFDSYDQMSKIRQNIDTLGDAKRALESGAQTGYFAQFLPDISRSATELASVRNRLGLEVVSSVTFGALSEAELNMALDTGLPENMDEDYLKGWVQERIDAKKKLLANLQEVTSFLARGNSIGDWMVELDKRATARQDEITPLATEISTMSIEEIDAIDPSTAGLSNAELQAYIKRANELRAN